MRANSTHVHDPTLSEETKMGVVQKVTFLGNTDNVNFGWLAYDSTDGHRKKCQPILSHAHFYRCHATHRSRKSET